MEGGVIGSKCPEPIPELEDVGVEELTEAHFAGIGLISDAA